LYGGKILNRNEPNMSKLLIVDDEPNVRYSLEQILQSDSLQVLTAETARQGIDAVYQHAPDVVLLDVRLPDFSGLDAFNEIHQFDPRLPVIIMTAHGTTDTAIEAMKRGAFEYLLKPFDLRHLRNVVTRALEVSRLARVPALIEGQETSDAPADLLVGRSPAMQEVYKAIGRVAGSDVAVLLLGESGSGKELVARAIYHHSRRHQKPFLAINCAAIPETLLESELFGHERGAFTGAERRRIGKFEQASGGTIFLDEIGDTSPAFQAKLLRVLQEREYYPVGGEEPRRSEARVLAATHQPIEQLVRDGDFREDLYFRLRVVEIVVPPLRERREDIPLLARHLVAKAARLADRPPLRLPDDVIRRLALHDWPGNVRELENTLMRAVVLAGGDSLAPDHLDFGAGSALIGGGTDGGGGVGGSGELDHVLEMAEKAHVQRVLATTGGHKSRSAEILQISRGRLDRLIEKHGLVVNV
jgi:DNA-binding NtrC family response regulator